MPLQAMVSGLLRAVDAVQGGKPFFKMVQDGDARLMVCHVIKSTGDERVPGRIAGFVFYGGKHQACHVAAKAQSGKIAAQRQPGCHQLCGTEGVQIAPFGCRAVQQLAFVEKVKPPAQFAARFASIASGSAYDSPRSGAPAHNQTMFTQRVELENGADILFHLRGVFQEFFLEPGGLNGPQVGQGGITFCKDGISRLNVLACLCSVTPADVESRLTVIVQRRIREGRQMAHQVPGILPLPQHDVAEVDAEREDVYQILRYRIRHGINYIAEYVDALLIFAFGHMEVGDIHVRRFVVGQFLFCLDEFLFCLFQLILSNETHCPEIPHMRVFVVKHFTLFQQGVADNPVTEDIGSFGPVK